jgi:hypothetical protein
MTWAEYKEANRFFWMIKSRLIPIDWSENDVRSIYDSYFHRLWINSESYYREEGFSVAWYDRLSELSSYEKFPIEYIKCND